MVDKRSIELEDDLPFENLGWKIQRTGWFIMLLIMLAALFGLTGAGPLSSRSDSNNSGSIRIEYNKFLHNKSPGHIQVYLSLTKHDSDILLYLERNFVQEIGLHQIVPEPSSQTTAKDLIIYRFSKLPEQGSAMLTLHIEPVAYGQINSVIRSHHDQINISQFIYP